MKNAILGLVLFLNTVFTARAYDVANGKQGGYIVIANNLVYIVTPDQHKIQVTKIPFVGDVNGYEYSIPPVKPILCTWGPNHKWLGIFIPVEQITEIYLFNLATNTFLEPAGPKPDYPESFNEDQLYCRTTPIKWKNNNLFVDTLVKFKDGHAKHYHETIIINKDTFKRLVE
jgi:hypothetical protein